MISGATADSWGIPALVLSLAISPKERAAGADEDRRLIDRMGRGDRKAFDELFKRHIDDVYRRLTRLIGPDRDREDLAQEVFLSAFKGLDRFRGEASFSTWLYRVIVHVAYGHLRKRKRGLPEPELVESLDPFIAPGLSPEAQAQERQQIRRALALLDRLKPKKRVAFVLRVVEGLSLQEIADIVEAKPAAVGQRVKHAQREIQEMIEREQRRQAKEART